VATLLLLLAAVVGREERGVGRSWVKSYFWKAVWAFLGGESGEGDSGMRRGRKLVVKS
jgi:hypothetical protein